MNDQPECTDYAVRDGFDWSAYVVPDNCFRVECDIDGTVRVYRGTGEEPYMVGKKA